MSIKDFFIKYSDSTSSFGMAFSVSLKIAAVNLIMAAITMAFMSINLIIIGLLGTLMYIVRIPLESIYLFFAVKKLKFNNKGVLKLRQGIVIGLFGSLIAQIIYMMIIPFLLKFLMPEIGSTGGAKLGFLVGGFISIFTTTFYGVIVGIVSGFILKSYGNSKSY